MDLPEFDRQADAAAKRQATRDQQVQKTRGAIGVGTPTRTLRCARCSYHLKSFARRVWVYAVSLPHENATVLWEQAPKPSRPWRTIRCVHCQSVNVYVIASD